MNFSSPVEIVIGGMSGKRGAWARGSTTLTAISTECNNATTAPTNIDAVTTRECYVSNGTDLIIWTYHFTSFAAYTPATTTNETTGTPSGGGEGDYWKVTYWLSEATMKAGYNRLFGEKERIKFKIGPDYHSVGVVSIATASAVINVSSESYQTTINDGETKYFDVNKDKYEDVMVTLNSINSSKANMTITIINKSMVPPEETAPVNITAGEEVAANKTIGEKILEEEKAAVSLLKNKWFWIIAGLIAVVGIIAVLYYFKIIKPLAIRRSVRVIGS
jgi:hypothetical protein